MYVQALLLVFISIFLQEIRSDVITFYNVKACFIDSKLETHCQEVNASNIAEAYPQNVSVFAISVTGKIHTLHKNSVTNTGDANGIIMNNNELKTIEPGAFGGLRNFTFNFENNEIERIEEGVFSNLEEVIAILLSHNKISYIHPKAFNNLPNLEVIGLSFNKLKQWEPDWFLGSPVDDIRVKQNEIEELPDNAFKYVNSVSPPLEVIKYIGFEDNKIQKIDKKIVEGVHKIKYFFLYGNPLKQVDEELCNNVTIVSLEVENHFKTNC